MDPQKDALAAEPLSEVTPDTLHTVSNAERIEGLLMQTDEGKARIDRAWERAVGGNTAEPQVPPRQGGDELTPPGASSRGVLPPPIAPGAVPGGASHTPPGGVADRARLLERMRNNGVLPPVRGSELHRGPASLGKGGGLGSN